MTVSVENFLDPNSILENDDCKTRTYLWRSKEYSPLKISYSVDFAATSWRPVAGTVPNTCAFFNGRKMPLSFYETDNPIGKSGTTSYEFRDREDGGYLTPPSPRRVYCVALYPSNVKTPNSFHRECVVGVSLVSLAFI